MTDSAHPPRDGDRHPHRVGGTGGIAAAGRTVQDMDKLTDEDLISLDLCMGHIARAVVSARRHLPDTYAVERLRGALMAVDLDLAHLGGTCCPVAFFEDDPTVGTDWRMHVQDAADELDRVRGARAVVVLARSSLLAAIIGGPEPGDEPG